MSVAAQSWAWSQKVPIKPKFVLVSLADQACELTGRVVYQKTDAKFLAEKCGVAERSLYRYIGALIRNGYVVRESGKERGRASEYWLCLDRRPASDIKEFQWTAADDRDDADDQLDVVDEEEGSAKMAEVETLPESIQIGRPGQPYLADQESLERPKIPLRAREAATPSGFSGRAQALERQRQAQALAEQKTKPVFVYENSRAYEAWAAVKAKESGIRHWHLTTTQTIEGKNRTGWFFPSLFPPPSTGPPSTLATAEDEKYFAEHG